MKIRKDKGRRKEWVKTKLEQVIGQISKTINLEHNKDSFPRKSANNICQVTGRAHGLVSAPHHYELSRFIYRKYADKGYLEGIRRGTW